MTVAMDANIPKRELTIVIPTYNEKENIQPLVRRLEQSLHNILWEAIFVDDDSPDGTSELIKEMRRDDDRIHCLHRTGKKGLSSACIEGIKQSKTPYVAVMDADLQHDENILPQMLKCIKEENLDLVVGSRYVKGGTLGRLSWVRALISRCATKVGQIVTGVPLKDPMSGYFLLTRRFFDKNVDRLNGKGFKILLDIYLSSAEAVKSKECPYQFRIRNAGKSKLGFKVIGDYFSLIFDKSLSQKLVKK